MVGSIRPSTSVIATFVFAFVSVVAPCRAAPPVLVNEATLFHLPGGPGGSAMLADNFTLVVSIPAEAMLLYFDTAANKERKKVEVDFKPGVMAVRGDTLLVAGAGTSIVHALDATTGKLKKSYKLESGTIARLACHPKKGLIYASTNELRVFSIDLDSGKVTKTEAFGHHIAVDPVEGKSLYTATQPPIDDDLVLKFGPDGEVRFYRDVWGRRAVVLAYAIKDNDLKLTAIQENASVNGYSLHLSPDGTKIMVPGGGGWRPKTGTEGGGYHTAIFGTDNLKSIVGEAPHAVSIAFHPVLNFGVANVMGREIVLFNAKSMKIRQMVPIAKGAGESPLILHIAAYGSKVVLFNGMNPKNPVEGLHFIPLDLQADEWAALEKAYGVKQPAKRAGPAVLSGIGPNPATTTGGTPMKTPGSSGTVQVPPPAAKKSVPALIQLAEKTTDYKLEVAEDKGFAFTNREYFWAKMPDEIAGGAMLLRPAESSNVWLETGKIKVLKECKMYAVIRYQQNKRRTFTPEHFKLMKAAGWEEVEGEVDIPGPPGEGWAWTAMKKTVKAGDEAFPLKGVNWPPGGQTVVYVFK